MNSELARCFERIADLLEISGGEPFRVNSYRRVSRILSELNDDIRVLHEAGVLREVKGIGKGTAAKIEEYLDTGAIQVLVNLEAEVPAGLPKLLEIPGLGPKKVALIHGELGVTNLSELKTAIDQGKVQELPGMGQRTAEKIAEGIAFLETSGGRTPRGVAMPIARDYAERLAALPGVGRVEIAGSLRRGLETIGDVDLLCVADDGAAVIDAFVQFPGVRRELARGTTKGSVTVDAGGDRELQVDLRVVPADSFGAAWQYFTGSKEHNVRLRSRASERGWKLNEWGLFDGEAVLAGTDEAGLYSRLELPWIPPELREDRDEFEGAIDFESLISGDAIRGDLHMHTVASDGKSTIEEMARAAMELGYAYIAITDHSKSSTIANGLSLDRMARHIEAIRAANARIEGIEVLAGCECDILPDGTLDYPDDILAACDIVVASIHAAMGGRAGKGKLSPTERTVAAIENPYVSIIGHPTGRLIHRRPAMDLDMAQVLDAALRTGTALEINASWQRLDLKDAHVRQAVQAGVHLAINTDAHRQEDLTRLAAGVVTARRGAAGRDDVINTLSLEALRSWIARQRS